MKWQKPLIVFLAFMALSVSLMPPLVAAQSISGAEVAARLVRARAGDAQEQFLLGVMYEHGKGVAQDYAQAAHWYGKAAMQDHMLAQVNLGSLHDKGLGLPQSYSQAYGWYHKAAGLGSGEAMYFIGSLYYNGDGVPTDINVAFDWLKKSNERGYPPARAAHARVKAELDAMSGAPTSPEPTPTETITSVPPPPVQDNRPQDVMPIKGYAVQIGSFKTEGQAQSRWTKLKTRAPDLFTDTDGHIFKKEFEAGRIFYRLNAALFQKNAEANSYCNTLKDKKIDCLVIKY